MLVQMDWESVMHRWQCLEDLAPMDCMAVRLERAA